jgi:hypothetical protein
MAILTGDAIQAARLNPISFVVIGALIRHGILGSMEGLPHLCWLRSCRCDWTLLMAFFALGCLHFFQGGR